jgi:hypothetical protein
MRSVDRSRQRGATLLNLALALGVGIGISAGAFWMASAALQKTRLEKTVVMIEEIAAAIYAGYANRATFAGLDEPTLQAQGILGPEFWQGANLRSPIGNMAIQSDGVGFGCSFAGYCDNGFRLVLSDLDMTECRFLAVHSMGTRHYKTYVSGSSGFRWITDGTTAEAEADCGATDTSKSVGYLFD